ncbi:9345_t:CDS:2 [Funneliformis caledonium]|uniref:9345_t:CDS:1 n=1 Tax=Funneliformis caledonium TaxID=1117310 RepID=A0A9N9B2H8_9GLOM|nr:9345_t:CDS:2 [Funneliformis caledonium]
MYHVSHNTKRYFAGYTEQDAEAEDATTVSQHSQHKVNSNNQFKPIASIHNSEIITKDIIQLGNHMSNRVPPNAGRRPGRPRYKK